MIDPVMEDARTAFIMGKRFIQVGNQPWWADKLPQFMEFDHVLTVRALAMGRQHYIPEIVRGYIHDDCFPVTYFTVMDGRQFVVLGRN